MKGFLRWLAGRAMRPCNWSLAFVIACALSGCANIPRAATPVDSPPVDTTGVFGLIGRFGIAHACPVRSIGGTTHLLTAAHVLDPWPNDRNAPMAGHTYTDRRGGFGVLVPDQAQNWRDLAEGTPQPPPARWYDAAPDAPKPGEPLWLVGWSWKDRDSAFDEPTLQVHVLRLKAGYIILRESVEPGTSGSCLLNAAGQAVGIISFGKQVGPGGKNEVAAAVAVYGPWLEMEPRAPDAQEQAR